MIKEAISKLIDKTDLTRQEAKEAMKEIMSGQATPAQISAYLVAMRMKGETADEITGSAEIMRQHATKI